MPTHKLVAKTFSLDFKTSINVRSLVMVSHHCSSMFTSIDSIAEHEKEQTLIAIFHDEEINCWPHLPRSLTRRGRKLSGVEHEAVPHETPRDSLYTRISTYHCMEAARPCVGTGGQIFVHLRCAAEAFQSFQLRQLQSICQWLGIQGLFCPLSFVQNISATIAIV